MSNILSKSILTYLNYISFNINELLSLTLIYFEDKIALNINGLLKPTLVGFNYVYNIISEFLLSINTIISEFLLFIYNIPFYNIPFYYIYVAIIFSTIIWVKLFRPELWKTKLNVFITAGKRLLMIYIIILSTALIIYGLYINTNLFTFINTDDVNWRYYLFIFRMLSITLVVYWIIYKKFIKAKTKDEFSQYIFSLGASALIAIILNLIFYIFFLDWIIVLIGGEESSSGSNSSGNNPDPGGGAPQPPKRPIDYSSILWKTDNNSEGSSSKSSAPVSNLEEESNNSRKRTREEAGLPAADNDFRKRVHPLSSNGNRYMLVLQLVENHSVERIRMIHPELVAVKKEIEAMMVFIDSAPGGLARMPSISDFGRNPRIFPVISPGIGIEPPVNPGIGIGPLMIPEIIRAQTPGNPGDPPYMWADGSSDFYPDTLEGIYNTRAGTTIQEEFRIKIGQRVQLEREMADLKRISKKIRVAGPTGISKVQKYLPNE
jgi:hypothetical protein